VGHSRRTIQPTRRGHRMNPPSVSPTRTPTAHAVDPPGHRLALTQKAALVRLPNERWAPLRAALRDAAGDVAELDDENARLYRLTTPASLDGPIGDEGSGEYVDSLAIDAATPEQSLIERDEAATLRDLLGVLGTRARFAVDRRFGLTDGRRRSYRHLAEELGSTAEAARRLVERALAAVRAEAVSRSTAA
jgi:hypothetical protein